MHNTDYHVYATICMKCAICCYSVPCLNTIFHSVVKACDICMMKNEFHVLVNQSVLYPHADGTFILSAGVETWT